MTMKTYWAWKHSLNSTHEKMSGYTKILARDIHSAVNKAQQTLQASHVQQQLQRQCDEW